jgi:RNA polymerase sigma factor (TIGR02999 family)
MSETADTSYLLDLARSGDPEAVDRLFAQLYDELRRLAQRQRRNWHGDETLNTTALVHEAYLKLQKGVARRWADRAHFHAVASQAMRHLLVSYAERRRAAKRGGGVPHEALDEANPVAEEAAEELLALNEALEALSRVSPRQARVVECRFFAGLSIRETAEALAVSTATVERDWALASAWLRHVMTDVETTS